MKAEAKAMRTAALAPATSPATLTLEDLAILKAPFSKDRLGVKVQSTNKDRSRAMLVLYLQHTDVQDRLEQVDPAWTTEVISEEREGDAVYVRIRMTVKGVSRENVGEGGDPKAAYSDALKRCAMLFGVGRYLYDSETVWTEYNEQKDRYRSWSVEDYERSLRGSAPLPTASASLSPSSSHEEPPRAVAQSARPAPGKPGLKTGGSSKKAADAKPLASGSGSGSSRSRDQLSRILMSLYRPYLSKFPETRFVELLQGRYNVGETRLMTVEQLEDLVQFMEVQLKSVA